MILNCRRLLKATAIGTVATVTSPFIIRDLHAQDIIKIAGIHDPSGGLDIYGKPMRDAMVWRPKRSTRRAACSAGSSSW